MSNESRAAKAIREARQAIADVATPSLKGFEHARLKRAHAAEVAALNARLAALSRIIRRTLACGQLEKLEDARPYLDDQPTPQRAGETESEG